MTQLPEKYLQWASDAVPEGTSFAATCKVARAMMQIDAQARSQAYEECAKIADDMADAWAEASKKLSDAGMISDGTIRAASLGARDVSQAIRSKANQ